MSNATYNINRYPVRVGDVQCQQRVRVRRRVRGVLRGDSDAVGRRFERLLADGGPARVQSARGRKEWQAVLGSSHRHGQLLRPVPAEALLGVQAERRAVEAAAQAHAYVRRPGVRSVQEALRLQEGKSL